VLKCCTNITARRSKSTFLTHIHCTKFNSYSPTNRDWPAFFQDSVLPWYDVASLNNQFSIFEGTQCTSSWKSLKFRQRLDPSGRRHCVIRNVGKLLPIVTASRPQSRFWKTSMPVPLFYLYILYIFLLLYIYCCRILKNSHAETTRYLINKITASWYQ
jgi:hypothetical protein